MGFAAIELLDAREDPPPPSAEAENDDPRSEPLPLPLPTIPPLPPDAPPVEEGSWGGWCRRRKRAPEGVRNAEM